MARLSIISAILTLFALTVTPVHAQDNSANLAVLIKQMAPYSQEFQLKKDQPSGAAWTGLLEKIQAADGLIIGEDHGIHEIPVLVEAMMPTLVQHGYRHYVMEVDPFTAALMERLAATGHSQAVEQQLKNYPYSLPFLTNREEFALLHTFYKLLPGNKTDIIWGLDQIFVFQARLVVEELSKQARDRKIFNSILERMKKADAEYFANLETKAPKKEAVPALYVLQDSDFQAMRGQLPAGKATELLDQLKLSQDIYKGQGANSLISNARREEFMKAQFDLHLRRKDKAWPKFFAKFGSGHMEQGRNRLMIAPLGGHIQEVAKLYQKKVFRLLILPAPGSKGRQLFGTTADSEVLIGLEPLYAQVKGSNPVIFDPTAALQNVALVQTMGAYNQALPEHNLASILLSFDAIIILPQAKPQESFHPK